MERLDPSEWLHFAQALDEGQRAMHEHGCGDGRKLLVEHKENGWAAWCYRCGIPGFVPHPRPSLSERIHKLRTKQAQDNAELVDPRPPMPAEFNPDNWPATPKVWLYKAGLDKDFIQALGIYWCPRIERVVLPVIDDAGKLIYWQARGFDPERAKYINPKIDKPLYKAPPVLPGQRDETILCLTEDILSAAKVGQVVAGWSILGTSLTPSQEAEIVKYGATKLLVWLDPDAAGLKGRRKLVPYLRSIGLDAKAIRAERDPKLYSLQDIRRLIHSA